MWAAKWDRNEKNSSLAICFRWTRHQAVKNLISSELSKSCRKLNFYQWVFSPVTYTLWIRCMHEGLWNILNKRCGASIIRFYSWKYQSTLLQFSDSEYFFTISLLNEPANTMKPQFHKSHLSKQMFHILFNMSRADYWITQERYFHLGTNLFVTVYNRAQTKYLKTLTIPVCTAYSTSAFAVENR